MFSSCLCDGAGCGAYAPRRYNPIHFMDELPGEQLQVIELAYFGGFTHTQIAEMLEMPVGTVKGRMRLGLEKLRRQLGEVVGA